MSPFAFEYDTSISFDTKIINRFVDYLSIYGFMSKIDVLFVQSHMVGGMPNFRTLYLYQNIYGHNVALVTRFKQPCDLL